MFEYRWLDAALDKLVAFPPLLKVSFHVNESTRLVRVTNVVRYGR